MFENPGRLARLTVFICITLVMLSSALAPVTTTPAAAQVKDGLRRGISPESGRVNYIGPETGRALPAEAISGITAAARRKNPAMSLARRFGPEFGLKDPDQELDELETTQSSDGRTIVRFQQHQNGIPVLGGELIVNTNGNGDLYSISGEASPDLSLLRSDQASLDPTEARGTALQSVAKWHRITPEALAVSEPELWIFDERLLRPSSRPIELVWRMEVTAVDADVPVRELVLVNAHTGGISLHFNQVDTAWQRGAGAEPQKSTSENPILHPVGPGPQQAASVSISTYTANNTRSLPGTFLCNQTDVSCAAGDSHAKAAHKYAIGTNSLYLDQHNRNGIDNNNMPVISTVHYDSAYANAFWSGEQMVYGDGYGFALADDVVAHELTHGVTQHESNLFYYYQSGAINESFSDLWGEYYDQVNGLGTDTAGVKWLVGEDISGYGAIRSMSNPPNYSNPDKMSSSLYYEGDGDNGGVHYNSGINNKAVFLMVDGGSFNGRTVSALGWIKTLAIYYEVQTNLLASGADYYDLYYALQQACTNLLGQKGITSTDCGELKDALDAVEMDSQPAPNFNTDAPLCDANLTPSTLLFDGLENGSNNWAFSNGTYTRWQVDSTYGPFAKSGLHSLYASDYPATMTDASARLGSFYVPANSYLHFAHAYGFESYGDFYYFDGGVLEYTINGGSTWLDAGSLIDFNGYDGTISSDYDNPLRGRSAFVGSSHGYISTRLNLSSLAGKTVGVRWRLGLDTGYSAWGWWVDNVRAYTCVGQVPGAATLTSPSGNTGTNYNPTYTWNQVSAATWYQLYVSGPSGNKVLDIWYQSGSVCSAGTCSAMPANTLGGGNHTWWVRTWNQAGYGPWSAGKTFSTNMPAAAGKVVLTSPNGSIGTNYSPTYIWSKDSNTTWYYLWVNGPSGNVIKQWYQASVVCGTSTCSATPSSTLGAGSHTWWIQTWNSTGHGPWSDAMSFSVATPALPGKATLVSPSGSISDYTPSYTWNRVGDATWYHLWVTGPSGNVVSQWYSAAHVCSASTCSVTPSTPLSSGAHTWWVRTWNADGYGPWSDSKAFNLP